METRNCQNCQKDFTIEQDDFGFYEKVKVPPPTFCPECRMIRRMGWRNGRSLYKRNCDLCQQSIISMYNPELPFPVYCNSCWYGDGWDPLSYAMDLDFSKPFLEQWFELWNKVPKFARWSINSINSDYSNIIINSKNCYLSYSIVNGEDIMYSENVDDCTSMVDSYLCIEGCNSCYYTQGRGNYNCKYVSQCGSCVDSVFCFDCVNCSDCFMSFGLRNKKYVFRGEQLTKEKYEELLELEKLGSRKVNDSLFQEWKEMIENKATHQYARIVGGNNATGNFIRNAKNIKSSFNLYNAENIAYGVRAFNSKDGYDAFGFADGELVYETMACSFGVARIFFSVNCDNSRDIFYSALCSNNSDLFGCISLRKKSYCILNKQYTKEEYEILVAKIKQQMGDLPYKDSKGKIYKYGEFFPIEMSPFCINETPAMDHFEVTEIDAQEKGYKWKERDKRNYPITKIATELPDNIKEVDDSILSEVIACPSNGRSDFQCTTAFRITENELIFYKNKNIPLPHYCPNCRHYRRLDLFVQPFRLFNRSCMCNKKHNNHEEKCEVEFETSYAPERPEIVYCEKCYQQEVY